MKNEKKIKEIMKTMPSLEGISYDVLVQSVQKAIISRSYPHKPT